MKDFNCLVYADQGPFHPKVTQHDLTGQTNSPIDAANLAMILHSSGFCIGKWFDPKEDSVIQDEKLGVQYVKKSGAVVFIFETGRACDEFAKLVEGFFKVFA